MCGILALLETSTLSESSIKKLLILIDNRGPDYQSPLLNRETKCSLNIELKASVLHLRGTSMQKQPVIDEYGNMLMFNGHVYKFSGIPIETEISDTRFLADKLGDCRTRDEIVKIIALIDGPFAFMYWSNSLNTLFYGRDVLGRRSLNALIDKDLQIHIISSIAIQIADDDMLNKNLKWVEVDCLGIYSLMFNSSKVIKKTRFNWNIDSIFPYSKNDSGTTVDENMEYAQLHPLTITPLNEDPRLPEEFDEHQRKVEVDRLNMILSNSISTRLSYNVDKCLYCRKTVGNESKESCPHSKVAVAYSGGVDSALLAIMLDKLYDKSETIDLINVAFKPNSPDRLTAAAGFQELRRLCPKRNWRLVLSDISPDRLQRERSNVIRHLISPCCTVIDDSLGCACWFIGEGNGRALDSTLKDEIFDEVFSHFLNFNSVCEDDKFNNNYTSPATILFAGMGIDEQLGGYSSHRSAWSESKSPGVLREISTQMRRIPIRNLSRDDRIFAHHARDLKLPYLDFDFISYLNSLPVGLKMDLEKPLDSGPKKLLRDLAHSLGLKESSHQIKRALQFGTRIAHLENSKEKGNQLCNRLR